MKTVRLSPSKLEQFRKYFDSEFNGFITKETVLDYFSGKTEFKQHINFGTAFQLIIENGAEQYWSRT